jgi:hypothetical protein
MNTDQLQALADEVVRRVAVMLASQATVTPEYMNTEDTAVYLGVSPELLEQWRSQGGGPSFHKLSEGKSSRVRYRRADIDAWMAPRRRSHTAQAR